MNESNIVSQGNQYFLNSLENAKGQTQLSDFKPTGDIKGEIGLSIHRSFFYGTNESGTYTSIPTSVTVFDSDDDIVLHIEGIVNLTVRPVNNGLGTVRYTGFGVALVNSSIIYDGRFKSLFSSLITDNSSVDDFRDAIIRTSISTSSKPIKIMTDQYFHPGFSDEILIDRSVMIEGFGGRIFGFNNNTYNLFRVVPTNEFDNLIIIFKNIHFTLVNTRLLYFNGAMTGTHEIIFDNCIFEGSGHSSVNQKSTIYYNGTSTYDDGGTTRPQGGVDIKYINCKSYNNDYFYIDDGFGPTRLNFIRELNSVNIMFKNCDFDFRSGIMVDCRQGENANGEHKLIFDGCTTNQNFSTFDAACSLVDSGNLNLDSSFDITIKNINYKSLMVGQESLIRSSVTTNVNMEGVNHFDFVSGGFSNVTPDGFGALIENGVTEYNGFV